MTEQVPTDDRGCNHDWRFVRDWYGDPNVINGTADCSFFRCERCGAQQDEQPDEYLDPADQEQPDELD